MRRLGDEQLKVTNVFLIFSFFDLITPQLHRHDTQIYHTVCAAFVDLARATVEEIVKPAGNHANIDRTKCVALYRKIKRNKTIFSAVNLFIFVKLSLFSIDNVNRKNTMVTTLDTGAQRPRKKK